MPDPYENFKGFRRSSDWEEETENRYREALEIIVAADGPEIREDDGILAALIDVARHGLGMVRRNA